MAKTILHSILSITILIFLSKTLDGKYLLVEVEETQGKCINFKIIGLNVITIDYNNSRLKIIKFPNASEPETCLTEGARFCGVQGPCCDGLSCEVKELITICEKDNSGKSHCPLQNFFLRI